MIEGEKGMRRSSDPNAHKQISLRLERDVAEGSCDVIIFESHCMFIFHLLRYGGAYDEELGTAVTLISRCFLLIIGLQILQIMIFSQPVVFIVHICILLCASKLYCVACIKKNDQIS